MKTFTITVDGTGFKIDTSFLNEVEVLMQHSETIGNPPPDHDSSPTAYKIWVAGHIVSAFLKLHAKEVN